MSDIEALGFGFDSRRYARDFIECREQGRVLLTRPWWFNDRQEARLRSEQAERQSDQDPFVHFSLKGMFK